jgi:putative two-component system response regulator
MKQLTDALDSAEAAFMALAMTIEARDPTTNGHCERLSTHAVVLGRALGLPGEDLEALHRGGYLHDVGKVGVPDSVLLKPGKLTPEEFALMQRHPDIGDMLCAPLQSLQDVRPIVRCHHERLNVPLLAQIVGIVDVYDALTSHRPYRQALSGDEAARHLMDEVFQGKFRKMHVEAFLDAQEITATV